MKASSTLPVRTVKTLAEVVSDKVRAMQSDTPGIRYTVAFQFTIPFQDITDSEALSALEKIQRALGAFASEHVVSFALEVLPINPIELDLESSVRSKMEAVAALQKGLASAQEK